MKPERPPQLPSTGITPRTSQTVGSPIPLPSVSEAQQRYLLKGLQGAKNTERAYKADLTHYTAWCEKAELIAFPATAERLGAYVSDLAGHKKWATITRRLAAIRKWHELHDLESPITDRWLKATLTGIQREHGTESKMAPAFKTASLKRIIAGLVTEDNKVPQFAALRDKVVLILGFTGAFRRSELVALDIQHIHFSEDGAVISYSKSKTNQTGKTEEKALFYSSEPQLCPVRTLRQWIRALERATGPLIVRVRKANELTEERLTDQSVNAIVKKYLGDSFTAHSLRASFVTAAKLNGADDSEIMQQTKHKTTAMIRRYTRLDSIKEHNAGKKLGW